jgi:lipid II:glycine glycyltransferase (peptidoglycan interpeptide bridge formation enzyme)
MDAENAWVLDLDKTDNELLFGMRKTTRYLIKKASALPIEVTKGTREEDFARFLKLYEETSRRHQFVPHRGVREEFSVFSKGALTKLFLAKFKRQVLAGALIVYYGNQAVYHHGASSNEHREVPAAYLVQWEAILDAKREGKKFYNFWGVVPPDKQKHPWQGLTLFKMGFGGRRINFIHAQDLPLNFNYWKTYAVETAWRIKRGY